MTERVTSYSMGVRRGYFQALFDLYHLFSSGDDDYPRTKKQYKNMVLSILQLLASDSYVCDLFREYGGFSHWSNNRVSIKQKPDGSIIAEYLN